MDKRVAGGYSDALFELASDEKNWDSYKQDLIKISDTLKANPEMMTVLAHPKVTKDDKKAILASVFEGAVTLHILYFLKLLIDKNRFGGIFDIVKAFIAQYNEAFGIVVAHVSTAHALDEQERADLIKMLETKTKKKIELVIRVDESLLAGIRIKIKDEVLDNTAKTRLYRMRNTVNSAVL